LPPVVLLGAHVSTAGGMPHAIERARELGCEAIQVFTRNQRQWTPRPLGPEDVAEFRARAGDYLETAVSHASYLINLCATDAATLTRSRAAFRDEIERCAALSIPYLCVHPGSHLGQGEEVGLRGIASSLRLCLEATRGSRVTILLENTAGQGTNLGWRLEHLDRIRKLAASRRIGFCIDTCHLFAAGYDLASDYEGVMDDLVATLGLARIRAFHLNDSKHACGSHKDRHEHIGEGRIGRAAFRSLVNDPRFATLPGLLETPGGPDGYKENLANLRRWRKMRAT